jgi:hypothetical protein
MKLTKKQYVLIGLSLIIVGVLIYVYVKRKKPSKVAIKGDVLDMKSPIKLASKEYSGSMPNFYNLRTKIDVEGKKKVFPFEIEKVTEGPIELPNRRSLINKDIKFRFIDVVPGEKIKIVALINLSYTMDHLAFNDDFLVTDKDNLLSYSQAVNNFRIV